MWIGDEQNRILRRLTSRRAQLVKRRTMVKNEIHAVLHRNLKGRPPVSDLFGKGGRAWLGEQDLPEDERHTVQGGLRQLDFLTEEVSLIDRAVGEHALACPEIRRLMTIPGVDVLTAATLWAAIGDISRFPTPRHLVGYLGLDLRVRQSGTAPARHGRISKQGSSEARHVLVEAAWVALRTPGPLRAFGQRIQSRRGSQIAAVAVAPQGRCAGLAPPHQGGGLRLRPPLPGPQKGPSTRTPCRRCKPAAKRRAAGPYSRQARDQEEAIALQAEAAYRHLVGAWAPKRRKGAGAATGARISNGSAAG